MDSTKDTGIDATTTTETGDGSHTTITTTDVGGTGRGTGQGTGQGTGRADM